MKAFREERKKTSAKRKKTIIPGPWTELKTKLKLKPVLKENHSICNSLGIFYGSYLDTSNWSEKGWYPIVINIALDNLQKLVIKHGIDQVIAACEKSLNDSLDENRKSRFGHLILLSLFSDNSQKEEPTKRFLSCYAKTNKKRIIGFMTVRKGQLLVIKPQSEDELD